MEQMDAIVYCTVYSTVCLGVFFNLHKLYFYSWDLLSNANFVWILQYTWHMTISKVFVLNNMLYLAGEDS